MKIFLFVIIIITSFYTNAQNAQVLIDGLKIELTKKPDDKKRATIYSDLTWYYSNISLDSAMFYGKKAITESTKLKDSTLIAQVYSDVGAVYFRMGNILESEKSYLKALEIRKIKNDVAGMAKVKANLANIYNKLGDKPRALKNYLETVDFFEKTKNFEIVAKTNANIGVLFNEIKNYPKALVFLNKAIEDQEANNKNDGLCTSYLSLGNVYLKTKDTLKALKFFNKSLEVSKKINNNIVMLAAMNNIAGVKSQQKKSNEAMAILNKSVAIRDSLNLNENDATVSLNIVKEKIMYSKFKEAQIMLMKLKKQFENTEANEQNLVVTYDYLIHTYAYLNLPDSVNYYNNALGRLRDKVLETTVLKQTAELETKYQTAKKEKQIIEQQADSKQKNFILLAMIALTILLSLIGYLIYRQQNLKNQQQAQEFQLTSAIDKIESQNKLQEQRLSISRDLHDNIGSQLTFIISSVDNIKYGFDITNVKLDNKLTHISNFAKDTILELRDTIWAMNSSEIAFEDLEIRINNFIEKAQISQENINFSFAIEESLITKKLTSVEGMNLYRTIQEAVNNALKYAQANTISINIKSQNNAIAVSIKDNGKGFDYDTVEKGNGLKNMQKRIEEIGGKFNLSSSENGTKIDILILK